MGITFNEIMGNQELIISTPKEQLKSVLADQTSEKIDQLMKRLSEDDWLKSLPKDETTTKWVCKLFSVLPLSTPQKSLLNFIQVLDNNSIPTPKGEVGESIFFENRSFLEKMAEPLETNHSFFGSILSYTSHLIKSFYNPQESKLDLLLLSFVNKWDRAATVLLEELFDIWVDNIPTETEAIKLREIFDYIPFLDKNKFQNILIKGTIPIEKLGDNLFFENRPLLDKVFEYKRNFLSGKYEKPENFDSKTNLLDFALQHGWHKSSKVLIEEFFDEDKDLLRKVCHYWYTTDEMYFYFSLYEDKYGEVALKKLISENWWVIWSPEYFRSGEALQKLLQFLDDKGIDPTKFAYHGNNDWLHRCHNLPALYLLLDKLNDAEKKKILLERGGEFLYNLLRDDPVNFENFLKDLLALDIPQNSFFAYKSLDNRHLFDRACLDNQSSHVKVLLKYIDNDVLRDLMNETYGLHYYSKYNSNETIEFVSSELSKNKKND